MVDQQGAMEVGGRLADEKKKDTKKYHIAGVVSVESGGSQKFPSGRFWKFPTASARPTSKRLQLGAFFYILALSLS